MEFLFALPIIFIPFLFPILGGCMAKSFGRKFWLWFWISLLLPFVGLIILLSLPDRSKKPDAVRALETDEFGIYT